ncbi:hypothetical protein BH10PSE12_BH10PSE12_07950 [soil metagenome]
MCHCPAHDDGSPSLSVRIGQRNLLFKCFAGCETPAILRALARLDPVPLSAAPRDTGSKPASVRWVRDRVHQLWGDARPVRGTPAEAYLVGRAIATNSDALRYHPRTPVRQDGVLMFRPALLCAVQACNDIVALQRMFLDIRHGGLASDLGGPRRMFGRPGRGAVRLAEPTDSLGLAEGVETAMAAMTMLGIPVWATLGAERLARIDIPRRVRRLILLPDNDAPGRAALTSARTAYAAAHRRIETILPPGQAKDWNDLLQARAGAPAGTAEGEGEGRLRRGV